MSKDSSKYEEYKSLRNDVKKAVDRDKIDYYKDHLQININNPKQLWQTIKQLGSSRNTKTKSSNIELNIDRAVSFETSVVAQTFNNLFTITASTLVNNLPSFTGNFGKQHIFNYYKNKHVTQDSFVYS